MPGEALNTLQLKITNDTNEATTSVDKLIKKVEKLRDAVSKNIDTSAIEKIKEASTAAKSVNSQTEKIAKSVKTVRVETEKVVAPAKKSSSAISKLFSSIGRIAFYRAIRTALKSVTQGFAEGVKHLYAWSEAFNTNFAPTMDTLKTQTTYLKNGFAAMFSPLIEWVVPNVIVPLTDALVELFNFIQQGFAILVGHDYWYKAQKSMTKFADSTKKANIQLAKFDELNNLTETGSGAEEDASGMFTLEKVMNESDSVLKDFAENFKKGFKDAFTADTDQLIENVERIKKSWENVFNNPKVEESRKELEREFEETCGAVVGSVTSIGTSFSVGVTGGVADASEKLEDFNATRFDGINKNLTGILQQTKEVAGAASVIATTFESDGFQSFVSTIFAFGDATLLSALEDITGFFKDIYTFFTKPFTDNASKIKDIGDKILDIASKLVSPLGFITDKIVEGKKSYEDSWIHKFFVEITSSASTLVGKALQKIYDWLVKVDEWLGKVGNSGVKAKQKLDEAFGIIWSKISKFVDGIKKFFTFEWEIPKPKVFDFISIRQKIQDAIQHIKAALNFKWSLPEIKIPLFDTIKKKVEEGVAKIKNALNFNWSLPKLKLPHIKITEEPVRSSFVKFLGVSTIPKLSVEWYANGGFPNVSQGSLFAAGEVPGQAEMVGNINGRTGVASGVEITGIREAVVSGSEAETRVLNLILNALERKQLVISPSAQLGRVVAQSNRLYGAVTG